jgi:hypothetical protein
MRDAEVMLPTKSASLVSPTSAGVDRQRAGGSTTKLGSYSGRPGPSEYFHFTQCKKKEEVTVENILEAAPCDGSVAVTKII